jgi:hypothetical protein
LQRGACQVEIAETFGTSLPGSIFARARLKPSS